jgi:uncharacterized membrane protein YeaQ/YmgE (transglycosylase-associated protein family)
MNVESFLVFLAIGLAAGWLASQVVGDTCGLMQDLLVGVLGAIIGGALFNFLGIGAGTGIVGAMLVALCGSIVLLLGLRLVRRTVPT